MSVDKNAEQQCNHYKNKLLVFLRIRKSAKDNDNLNEEFIDIKNGKTLLLKYRGDLLSVEFSGCYGGNTLQLEIYKPIKEVLSRGCKGDSGSFYNHMIFAYGQTGSGKFLFCKKRFSQQKLGKTYTMFGPGWDVYYSKLRDSLKQEAVENEILSDTNVFGVIPRSVVTILQELQ